MVAALQVLMPSAADVQETGGMALLQVMHSRLHMAGANIMQEKKIP